MFQDKKKELISNRKTKTPVATVPKISAFGKAGLRTSVTTTALGNHAVKVTTTGSDFVDQFGKCTIYKKPRTYSEVASDMQLLWSQDQLKCVQLAMYFRLITRQISFSDGTKTEHTQRGQGLKHEGVFRLIWLAINHPDTFWKNIHLFVAAGGWKDVITMLSYDLQFHGWEDRKLDWDNMGQFILAGLENPRSSELVKKYLPQIKSNSVCNTIEAQADNIIAKWICSLVYGTKGPKGDSTKYKAYRKLKSSGTAHTWQQLISQGKKLQIDFDTIHGRALALLVSGKFLKNSGLEAKYTKWIESKPVAKYTGYVYELFQTVHHNRQPLAATPYQKMTVNKQFDGLIETAKKGMKTGDNGLLVICDTSGSMESTVQGTKVSAYDVAKGLALYFSYLLKGRFEGLWAEFSDECVMKQWKGSTPLEKLQNDHSSIIAGTNFQSIAKLFGQIRKQGVPESDFPSGILCISDGCFNHAASNKSNFNTLKDNLRKEGFSKEYIDNFRVILWDVPNGHYSPKGHQAFEDFADCPNLFHIGGLDGSAVAFITGVEGKDKKAPSNSEELFEAAMEQEILEMITV